jgi:hypothetical protein
MFHKIRSGIFRYLLIWRNVIVILSMGFVINVYKCPKKCEFSCRIEDFHQRSPAALLFFGEDFYWPFKLTDQNRTSFEQRWIFWSWEAPIHHREYTKSPLKFNWFVSNFFKYCSSILIILGQ